MILRLESYGMNIIAINKKGYKDKGENLIKELSLYRDIISESDDLIAFELTPEYLNQSIPVIAFPEGWSDDEVTHRWAMKKKADIAIFNFNNSPMEYILNYSTFTLRDAKLSLYINSEFIQKNQLVAGSKVLIGPIKFTMQPGKNIIRIKSDTRQRKPGNGDPRKLTFAISNFKLTKHE